jgi:hypothetical protein
MNSDTLFKSIGGILVLLGIVIALSGWFIFPVCEMHGFFTETKTGVKLPMPCGYTARPETGIGALIVVAGGLLLARNTPETRQAAGIFSLACRALVILFSYGHYRDVQISGSSLPPANPSRTRDTRHHRNYCRGIPDLET